MQLAYLHDDGVNYMIKMKDDTLDFNKLWVAAFFNFSESSCDPFFMQTSVRPKNQLAAGGGIRSLKKQQESKNDAGNIVLIPLDEDTVQKAKAC